MERVTEAYGKDEVMALMDPLVSEWFGGRFSGLTEPQSYAIPLIHRRESVLVSSPTGSGKTLTAFLSIINELLGYSKSGRLEDRVYAVYVSPLKALANDINRNLREPLREMRELAELDGIDFPEIRVGVRSGDTSQAERQKMLRKPPHIFITTPESLALVLAAPKFREKFSKVEWVIVDEVHEMCDSKRGVFLSLTLERLQAFCANHFVRVGLSATLAPIEEIASFLVGCENGRQRGVKVVEVKAPKNLDLKVICPTDDMTALPYEIVNSKMYDSLRDLVDRHTTTLVFTNTRSGTESVVYKLKERGLESVEAHHGSLSKETRLDVEERLKRNELKCVVSSTSLELGIDIGSIDLVCQIGSPKSVAKALQRIGRSGHAYGQTSKGRMIVFDNDDLVECAVLCRAAHAGRIDRVTIPSNCLDVLAQTLVGMSIEKRWDVDEAYDLVKRSYCYAQLSKETFLDVLRYLGSKDAFEGVYSKLWYDESGAVFGKKKSARMIYFLNLGTIPEEANYKVYGERGAIGDLSEKFVEHLSPRDIFVLGGKTYEFVRSKGMSVFVKSASGKKPTVPSWTGEMLPRSFDLSQEVARFRRELASRLDDPEDRTLDWLCQDFDIDRGSARSVLSYFREQRSACGIVPTDETLMVEGYCDLEGVHNVIFHFPFGRRVNDALSRAYAFQLTQELACNISVSVTDDAFMLSVPRKVDLKGIERRVSSAGLESVLRRALHDSEIFKQRFRHTAARSFMILRNYKGREVSVNRQQVRSSYLLDTLRSVERAPVIDETYREILEEVMDVQNAKLVLRRIEEGRAEVRTVDFSSVPSPFSHNVVLAGISDIVLMEDRSSLLKALHRKILSRVMARELDEVEFQEEKVASYFMKKVGRIERKGDILRFLGLVGPMRLFRERARSLYPYSTADKRTVDGWGAELLAEGKTASVYSDDCYFVHARDLPAYAALFTKDRSIGDAERRVLEALESTETISEVAAATGMSSDKVTRAVRKLESAFLVGRVAYRNGKFHFAKREVVPSDRQASLDLAVSRYLEGFAPATLDEISFSLGLREAEVAQALSALVNEGTVVRGKFLVSEKEQYMLRRDYIRLKSENSEAYDIRSIESYRRSKVAGPFGSIEECMRALGPVGDPIDVFRRVPGFTMEDWEALRRSGKILLGRFVRGRVRYVLAEDAPMYVLAYRDPSLSDSDMLVLELIRQRGSATLVKLCKEACLPKERARSSLDWLDRNLYVVRRSEHREEWARENVYEPLEVQPFPGDARKEIVKRFVRAHGPVSMAAIAAFTGFPPEDLRGIVEDLGLSRVFAGDAQAEMLVMPEELEGLRSPPMRDRRVRVLSLYDPDVQPLWSEIAARFGDRRVSPVMSNGTLIGAVEKWSMSGCVEVRSLDLDDPSLLRPVLSDLDEMMRFYGMMGYEILRIREVLGKGVEELDEGSQLALLEAGYSRVGSFLAKGRFIPRRFSSGDLLAYVLWRQGIPKERRSESILDGLSRSGGFRSDYEAYLRCRVKVPLKRLQEQGTLVRVQGMPEFLTYTTLEFARIFRKAKDVRMTEDMRSLVRILEDRGRLSRDELFSLSPVGQGRSRAALRSLYVGGAVYFDRARRACLVPDTELSREEARKEVVRMLFRSYGLFSAEGLASFIRFRIPMKEVREMLATLEAEGLLVKGYFNEDDDNLYWMLAEDVGAIGLDFADSFVLTPNDNLHPYLLPIISRRFGRGRSVIFRGREMIGAFRSRTRGKDLQITEFVGDSEARVVLKEHIRTMGLTLKKSDGQTMPDWEIQEFYEKTHPGEA